MLIKKKRDTIDVLKEKNSHFRDLFLEFWEDDGEIRTEEDERIWLWGGLLL
jgi:uncharacterized protein YdcH (DUF465 family)